MYDLADSIAECRTALLSNLLEMCRDLVSKLIMRKGNFCKYHNKDCDAHTLGSLMVGLGCLNWWPIPISTAEMAMSVNDLSEKLRSISVPVFVGNSSKQPHDQCSRKIVLSVKEALEASPFKLLDSHRRHLDAQSRK